MKKIANIINFVRSVEPRREEQGFLFDTLREELALCDRFGFRSTVLLQYDALIDPAYQALVKAHPAAEPGLWLEIVEPLARAAGLPWRGRWVWDWDVRCAFLTGYTPTERERLLDAAFRKFKEIFGRYPASAGCWAIDAHALAYMEKTYGLRAFCCCKEQFGTDGITLWGGYQSGGYYPSRNNALLPARDEKNGIYVPVFRMLGADPIDQYDLGLGSPDAGQTVCSLEPVYPPGGGSPRWVDWFLQETYGGPGLTLAYAQFGQENSFGWNAIAKGLPMQFEKLRRLTDADAVELQTLSETGAWFAGAFRLSPPTASLVESDPAGAGRQTLWYNARFYRVNLLYEKGRAWLRDFQLYADAYTEPYLNSTNVSDRTVQFALPVTDGFRFSANGVRAGLYPYIGDEPMAAGPAFCQSAAEPDTAMAVWGDVTFTMREDCFSVRCALPGFHLRFVFADLPAVPYERAEQNTLFMRFTDVPGHEFHYALRLKRGRFTQTNGVYAVWPAAGEIVFDCEHTQI